MFDAVIKIFNWIPDIVWILFLTYFLGRMAWAMWMHYIQQSFISGIDYVLLEVIPPREVLRSPRAMELFFTNALYHWSMKGGREEYWQGAVWFWYSLEIVSIEGQVRFYIRTPSRIKGLIETQMYAQYPQSQVRVVDDYTFGVDEITPDSQWNLYGCEWKLEKPDAYPIKTYADFGLDEQDEETLKIDPLSPLIELFASMGKGEQMWFQMVIRPSKNTFTGPDGKKHDWVEESKQELERLFEKYARMNVIEGETLTKVRPPFAVEAEVKGISTKMQKIGFDVGLRTCYVAKKENFDANNRRNLRLVFRQYANPALNSFTRVNGTQADAYGGLITVLNQEQVMELSNRMLGEYRGRSFYHGQLRQELFDTEHLPWPISPMFFKAYKPQPTFVLNVEEIATLWHFPGQILKIPTLERVESKEASPPTNLPT
ncbi:MAG: hypothetical protein WC011_01270 [Candidatus Paceibacterota bacterium]